MIMQTFSQSMITIAAVVLGTVMTRMLPFFIFPASRPTPKYIRYLGITLAPAVIGLLIVYCMRTVSFTEWPLAIPEMICIAVTILLHVWQRKILLSIAAGTILYMLLVQFVFTM